MVQFKAYFFPVAALILGLAAVQLAAQTGEGAAPSSHHSFWHRPATQGTPFPADSGGTGTARALEFRTAEQMSRADRDLAADGESSIAERAGFAGLGFNEGKWSYRQIVCPAFPKHLFLQFTRNNGQGDVSMFSASIPRGGEGKVRVVPIQRRGYSLFSPAPINALTMAAFNRIRREENAAQTPDWLAVGLCYAALAGAQPVAAPWAGVELTEKDAPAPPSELILFQEGGAQIRFADVAAPLRPMLWTMTFDGTGKLIKAKHEPASLQKVNVLTPAPVDANGTPLTPAPVDEHGRPIV